MVFNLEIFHITLKLNSRDFIRIIMEDISTLGFVKYVMLKDHGPLKAVNTISKI